MPEKKLNWPQKRAIVRLIHRWGRRPDKITPAFFDDCWMVQYDNLWIGIEKDGYAHS